MKSKKIKIGKKNKYAFLCVASFLFFAIAFYVFTGKSCFMKNVYNTYALQADSWRQGRLDLGENYSWLEIAEYNGKYYCSFPPFPSYVLFPFTIIFGSDTPDSFILLVFDVIALIYIYRIALYYKLRPEIAALTSLFFLTATNMVFIMFDPSVWFFAQSMSFTLELIAIYYALNNKVGISLFAWACAVGCRPMQIVFFPVLMFILLKKEQKKTKRLTLQKIIRKWAKPIIPTVILAISYMLLNYCRFGSILEFGHNYLPEFVETHKQFSIAYIPNNFHMLMHWPDFQENGRMVIDHFGNINIFLINPPFVFFVISLFVMAIKRQWKIFGFSLMICILSCLHMVFIMMHATMGGWHFGNRYSNDTLPFICLGIVSFLSVNKKFGKWEVPFLFWGLAFNIVGTIVVHNGLG